MMKKSIVMSIGLSTVALAMGATDVYAAEKGIVTTDVLNVRSAPGTSNSIVGKLYRGNTVDILESSNGWQKIQMSNGKTGWASSDYIKLGTSNNGSGSNNNGGTTEEAVSGYGTITTSSLNVRSGIGTSYAVISKVYKDDTVELLSKSNGWYKIKLSNGKIGWASGSYIKLGASNNGNGNNNGSGNNNNGGTTEEAVSGYGTITTSSLNVRSGIGTSYAVISKVYKDDTVELLSKSNGWYKIKLSNGKIGWASGSYIKLGASNNGNGNNNGSGNNNNGGTTEEAVSGYGTVTASSLNVRSGASTSYAVISKVYKNDTVELLSKSNGWYKIKLSNGKIGWASDDYIKLGASNGGSNENKPSNSRSSIVNLAKQQLGKPYEWGAEGPNSFDCSGLTYYVYKNASGVTLPRTSSQQSNFGKTVSKSNLQPGDLVFSSTDGSGKVNHVSIYIGNGKMIHSPKPGEVVNSVDLNSSYWNKTYLWSKSVL